MIQERDVMFSLVELKSPFASASYELVLKISDVNNKNSIGFICFEFYSLDTLILCIRLLARNSKCYSLERLRQAEFPAKIKFREQFNRPEIFKAFYLPNNLIWPPQKFDVKARFLMEVLE